MLLYHLPTPFSIYILTLNALKYSTVKKSFKLCLNLFFLNLANQDIQKYYFPKQCRNPDHQRDSKWFSFAVLKKKEESRQIKYI